MRHHEGPGAHLKPMLDLANLLSTYNSDTGEVSSARLQERHLSDLRGCFADASAFQAALAVKDPLIYSVAAIEPGSAAGDLHYGLGRILPGKIGQEYFMTKGHAHAQRSAAEFYFGLAGEGLLLLEDLATGETRIVPLRPSHAVYVPGNTAHRTINTGRQPLVYLGVYPATAGHDYELIARKNFRHIVTEHNGQPRLLPRPNSLA